MRLGDVRPGAVVGELDVALVELLEQPGDLLLVELELGHELVEGGQVHAPELLAVLHQDTQLIVAHGVVVSRGARS